MFWEKYNDLCIKNGESANGVAKKLGVSSGTVTGWKQGRTPRGAIVVKISEYFNVPVDYLLNGAQIKPDVIDISLCDKETADIIKKVLTLSKEEVIALKQILKA